MKISSDLSEVNISRNVKKDDIDWKWCDFLLEGRSNMNYCHATWEWVTSLSTFNSQKRVKRNCINCKAFEMKKKKVTRILFFLLHFNAARAKGKKLEKFIRIALKSRRSNLIEMYTCFNKRLKNPRKIMIWNFCLLIMTLCRHAWRTTTYNKAHN